MVLHPFLDRHPEHTHTEIAESETATRVDPAKQRWVNPATTPAKNSTDDNAPEERAEKEAREE